jgi:hypothetical protein
VIVLTLTQFGCHMAKVIEIYEIKSKNYESFGHGLDNKNMISLNKLMCITTILGYTNIFTKIKFPTQMKVNFQVLDRRGG